MTDKATTEQRIKAQLATFFGACGVLLSLTLFPVIFQRYFAVAYLLPNERSGLWLFFSVMMVCSLALILLKRKIHPRYVMLFFAVLFLVGIEQVTRLYVHYFYDTPTRDQLWKASYVTYPEYAAYQGHPFVAFTGMPSVALQGNEALGGLKAFNNYGFLGNDFVQEKPTGTVRIACMGGSTTASGYPAIMEQWLNEQNFGDSVHFEVLNFGITYWTTAHSMVNYLLNVQDFNPDYVVIHHAWNEEKVRDAQPGTFRSDYSHAFSHFHEPDIPDKWPLRISLAYRLAQDEYGAMPPWQMLEPATTKPRDRVKPLFQNLEELAPYERNIKTILDLAELRGTKVVLTTQPHSTDPDIPLYYAHPAVDQGNAVMRTIQRQYADKAVFVDLDSMMSGPMNAVFKDLGHVHDEGKQFKAGQIGQAILADLQAQALASTVADSLLLE